MRDLSSFSGWLRIAEYLLEPEQVARIVVPTLADALFERNTAKSHFHWLWRTRFQLACAVCGAVVTNGWQRLRSARWLGFLALSLAGLSGAAVMKLGQTPQFARSQLLLLTLAALVGLVVIAVPSKPLRHLGTAALVLGVVGLAACPWLGVAYDGRRQWLDLGSLQIHVATLALPGFVVFVRRTTAAKSTATLLGGTLGTLVLLLLQPNLEAVLVYALTAGTAMIEGRTRWLSWAMMLATVIAVGLAATFGKGESGWSLLGSAALAMAVGWGLLPELARGRDRACTQSLTMAMVSLLLARSVVGDTLPVVGFGGSALVAFFVLLALQLREPHHHLPASVGVL